MVFRNDQSPSADFIPLGPRAARNLKHGALHRQPPAEGMNHLMPGTLGTQ
jgi:hypothetical protein